VSLRLWVLWWWSSYVFGNPRVCGPVVSVGTLGTTYGSHGNNIHGDWNNDPLAYTNLGNPCPAPPPPPPSPPSPPSPPPANEPCCADEQAWRDAHAARMVKLRARWAAL
jgi:hypothetical protein